MEAILIRKHILVSGFIVSDFLSIYFDLQQLNFTQINFVGPPKLYQNLLLRIREDDEDITINLNQNPAVFPKPRTFKWSKDGKLLSADLNVTYFSVTFSSVRKSDAGNYTVYVANFLLENSSQQIENVTGSFVLDVICKL